MRTASILVAAILLTIAGCASRPTFWHRPGVTEAQFQADQYACYRDALGLAGPSPAFSPLPPAYGIAAPIRQGGESLAAQIAHGQQQAEIFEFCMKSKGYSLVTEDGRPAE